MDEYSSGARNFDQIYHVLLAIRDLPLSKPVLNAEVINKAQQLLSARLAERGTIPISVGSMQLEIIGKLISPTGRLSKSEESFRELIIEKEKEAHEVVVSRFVPAEIRYADGNSDLPIHGEMIWYFTDEKKARIQVQGRIFRRLGLQIGGCRAFYLDEESGLVFTICVNTHLTQSERINYAATTIDQTIRAEEMRSGFADVYEIILREIKSVSLEIRREVLTQVLESMGYNQRMTSEERQRLLDHRASVFWGDMRSQIESFNKMVEDYRAKLPDEANLHFPRNTEARALPFRIATPRAMELAKEWLKRQGVDLAQSDKDLEAYLRAMEYLSVLNGWISLPLDRALLLAFREAVFNHPDLEKSHLHALRTIAAAQAAKLREAFPPLTVGQAKANYEDALKRLDESLGFPQRTPYKLPVSLYRADLHPAQIGF